MITEQSDDRLVLTQQANEKRVIAAIGVPLLLGLGAFFYFVDDGSARVFGYVFGGLGVLMVPLIFMRHTRTQLLLDRDVGDLTLRLGRAGGRRVIRVPLEIISHVDLAERGNLEMGFYKQVEFIMHDSSGKRPLSLPTAFTGMSQENMHEAISKWAEKSNAFGPSDRQND